MIKTLDDTLSPYTYKGVSGSNFVVISGVFAAAYVTLAILETPIPHGLDVLVGAAYGVFTGRTFKPIK